MLDPAANARALGEIQTRGLRAAGELVDRLIGAVDDADDGSNQSVGRRAPSPDTASATPVTGSPPADLLHAWMDVFQRGLQAMAAMARPGPVPAAGESIATADIGRGTVTGAVHITVGSNGAEDVVGASDGPPGCAGSADGGRRPGRKGSAEVWLHNGTAEPTTALRPHCGDLRAHDGSTLPASTLRFEPASLDELPARSSRGLVVTADVADGVPGGAYRGVLLVAGAPDVWLPIVVTVASEG